MASLDETLKVAVRHHQRGRFEEAGALYQQILAQEPDHAHALYLLGALSHQRGDLEKAIELIRRAIDRDARVPEFHSNLAVALKDAERLQEAEDACREALRLRPDFVAARVTLAAILMDQDRAAEAEACYRRVLQESPQTPAALNGLGLALKNQGRLVEAGETFRCLLAVAADSPEAHNNLGGVLAAQGRSTEAQAQYKTAIGLHPGYAQAWNNLGLVFQERGHRQDAEMAYREALCLEPHYCAAHNNLGDLLHEDGRLALAEAAYRRALKADPRSAETLNNLGGVLQDQGQMGPAAEAYRRALHLRPKLVAALRNLVQCSRYGDCSHQDARAALALLDNPALHSTAKAHLHFALGKVYDDCGRYTQAFEHYREGNRLEHQMAPFDQPRFAHFIDELIGVFDRRYFELATQCGSHSEIPVFIVGMPRSGTTLIEQIIASHPGADGAGELPTLNRLAMELAVKTGRAHEYPRCIADMTPNVVAGMAAEYLERLTRDVADAATRVTDKMPLNFYHLGLIHRLFPNARIVHCRRNPMDNCLSIYFQYFARGNRYAYSLANIATFYRQYDRMMAHWANTSPQAIHELQYEDLIADPQTTVSRLLDHLGLPWDEACLSFQRTQRGVQSASSWQVRQPLYNRSVGRWRNYAQFLAELKEDLGDLASRADHPEQSERG